MIGVLSKGIWSIPGLAAFFDQPVMKLSPFWGSTSRLSAIAGWGQRPSTGRARALAKRLNIPFISLEDGFIRSIGLGRMGYAPWSIVIDDLGIYYDATKPSRLEELIRNSDLGVGRLADVQQLIKLIKINRLSKYNQAPDVVASIATRANSRVLVVDQTLGDLSVKLGGADASTFNLMLQCAVQENPDAEIWVKTHPDVMAGKRHGYLSEVRGARVKILAHEFSPLSVIECVDKVYTVTSQMGFEALLLGKDVVTFGLPWYSGWGLTDDRSEKIDQVKQRRGCRPLAALVSAAYFDYAKYVNPITRERCSIFHFLEWLVHNKICCNLLRGNVYCVGMSLWKRSVVAPFLKSPTTNLFFLKNARDLEVKLKSDFGKVVVWGGGKEDVRDTATRFSAPLFRLEDGFVRSAGLGSDLRAPLSLALDEKGIYYNPVSGSDLERILSSVVLNEEQVKRARDLRDGIIRLRISKYNVGGAKFSISCVSKPRAVVLVPGQVEDDASIRYGSPKFCRNLDLLKAVRANRPNAWIVYKPHPDVVARNRKGAIRSALLTDLVDQIVVDVDIVDCIDSADEIHTMTSLAGFEALLRGKEVHCYGAPFYAGWGLTTDYVALPNRARKLSIEQLIFGVLCLYPRYRLPNSEGLCQAEDVVRYLSEMIKKSGQRTPIGSNWGGRQYRKAKEYINALRALK